MRLFFSGDNCLLASLLGMHKMPKCQKYIECNKICKFLRNSDASSNVCESRRIVGLRM